MTSFRMKTLLVSVFLMVSVALLAGAAGQQGGSEEATASGAVRTGKYGEAPMLAEMVKAGQLPPVDQRLPENPMVIQVVDEMIVSKSNDGDGLTFSAAKKYGGE